MAGRMRSSHGRSYGRPMWTTHMTDACGWYHLCTILHSPTVTLGAILVLAILRLGQTKVRTLTDALLTCGALSSGSSDWETQPARRTR